MSTSFLSLDQLKRALAVEEKMQALRQELAAIYAEGSQSATTQGKRDRRTGSRSAATRAKMAAAQRARWARANGAAEGPSSGTPKRKRKRKWTMSAGSREKISAAQRRRWAAQKSGKK